MCFAGARRAFAAAANGGFARLALRGLSAVSSSAANVAPRRLSSNDVHVVEKFKNGEFEWYKQAQHALTKVAPENGEGFNTLFKQPRQIVCRDITPSFELLGAFKPEKFVTLLRGRRWGKTVLLDTTTRPWSSPRRARRRAALPGMHPKLSRNAPKPSQPIPQRIPLARAISPGASKQQA